MNERQVFSEALDIENPVERTAYLDKACAGQPELRARVEALLTAHDKASQFLERPATEKFPTGDYGADMTQAFDTRTMPPAGEGAQEASDADESIQTVLRLLEPSSQPGSLGRLGHYEILQVLGQGGFGIVFKAFDEKLHRPVAIKMMSPQMAATSPPRKRFLREARSAAAMHHENVVSVHSVEEQPLPYLVMEYVNGQTLQQKLDGIGPLDLFEILHLGRQIAAGLAAAHSHGLIHRDIKPANILIEQGADQRVKITDFGLARAADDASMTQTGFVAGTPMYMAPEQATGETLDHRADLFSLGSVLYVMTAGRPPFRAASTLAVLRRVVEDMPRPIPEIIPETPDWLCAIISKLHAKQPEQRFETAKEVADLLARCHAELQMHGKVEAALPADLREAMEACRAGQEATAMLPVAKQSVAVPVAQPALAERPRSAKRRPLVAAGLLLVTLLIGLAVTEATGVTQLTALVSPSPAEPEAMNQGANDDSTIVQAQTGKGSLADSETSTARQEPLTETTTSETPLEDETIALATADDEPDPTIALTAVNLPSLPEWQLPEGAPAPANVPFSPEQAKTHQEAWAAYLKRPVVEEHELGMKFALIPPGDFVSTAPADDQPLESKALARRKSRIMAPFQLAATEVTLGQYRQFVEETGHRGHFTGGIHYLRGDSSLVQGEAPWLKTTSDEHDPQQAVTHVNWDDAVAFCHWLSQKSGRTYRLPTEEEWEYAYCAGTIGFLGGCKSPQALPQFGWFREECVDGDPAKIVTPRAVGTKKANAFGLYDVAGNVWEWCHYGGRLRASLKNPQIGAFEPKRVLHGKSYPDPVETTERNPFDSGERRPNVGFRMLCELPESASFEPDLPPLTNESDSLKKRLPEWRAPADAPPLAIVPFSPAKAKQHQQRWADYLKKPVEEANSLGMSMVLIPPGEFYFLHTPNGAQREPPTSSPVRIARPFYLGSTEVSSAQFGAFIAETGYVSEVESTGSEVGAFRIADGAFKVAEWANQPGSSWKKPSTWVVRPDDPVVAVTTNDARAFCAWLSRKEGVRYRLADEAEWAFACLAGADNPTGIPLGYGIPADYAWLGRDGLPINESPLMPAKSLAPNPFGLFHMYGNTHEFCEALNFAAQGPSLHAIYHGNGWNAWPDFQCSFPFFRDTSLPMNAAGVNSGFRVVREIDDLAGLPPASEAVQLPLLRETDLGPAAIVRYPTKLPGLRTWTLTTRQQSSSSESDRIAISSDGKRLATASIGERIIRVWSDKLELERVLVGHTDNIVSLAFSPDNRYLASRDRSSQENEKFAVHVWEVATGRIKCSTTLEGDQFYWSPDSRRVAVSEDGYFGWRQLQPAVLDIETGILHRLPGKVNGAGHARLAWSPEGDRIAAILLTRLNGQSTQLLRLYDAQTYELLKERPLDIRGTAFAWSPEGNRIAFQGPDFVQSLSLHTDEVQDIVPYQNWAEPIWLSDGKRLVIRDENGVRCWNLKTAELEQSLPAEDYACSLLADGRLALFDGNRLKILDVETWKIVHEASRDPALAVYDSVAAVSPDGQQVATSAAGQLTLWDANTGKFLRRFAGLPEARVLSWSPKADRILAGWGGTFVFVSLNSGQIVQLDAGNHAASWSPSGAELAAACPSGELRVFDVASGKSRIVAKTDIDFLGVAWSPDGERLAFVTETELRFWDISTDEEVGVGVTLGQPLNLVQRDRFSFPQLVAWHPDGKTVFVAGSRIEWQTGKTVGGYHHENFLELSPDGRRLAVTGYPTTFVSAEGGNAVPTRHFVLANWLPDSRRLLGRRLQNSKQVVAYDADENEPLGTLIPRLGREQFVCIGPDGHYRGSRRVDEHLVYVAVHDDGSQTIHTPEEFEKQFGWKNDPDKTRFLALDPKEQQPAVEEPLPSEPKPAEPTAEPLDKGLVWPRTVAADVELPADEPSRESDGPVSPLALVPQPSAIEGLESWSVETYAHRGPISAIAVHPTGPIVATGGDYDGSIRLCDLECNVRSVLLGHDRSRASGAITALAWSPGGRWLASCGSDRTLRIWDAPAGKLQQSTALEFIPSSLRWSNEGTKVALTGETNGWALFDLVTRAAHTRPDTVRNVLAWHENNGLIATVGEDSVIRHWDLETLSLDHEVVLANIEHPIHRAVLLPDGKSLAAIFGNEGKRLGTWNLTSGEMLQSTSSQAGFGNVLACSGSGALVTADRRTSVWDSGSLALQWQSPIENQPLSAVAFGHDRMFTASGERLRVQSPEEGVPLASSPERGLPAGLQHWFDVDSKGSTIWVNHDRAFTQLWSTAAGRRAEGGYAGTIFRVSPDGQQIAEWNGTSVRIRDAVDGHSVQTFTGLEVWEVRWSPDSRHVAMPNGNRVRVCSVKSGKVIKEFGPLAASVLHLQWSPDGKHIAAGTSNGELSLWPGKNDEPVWKAEGFSTTVLPGGLFDWSPSGGEIAVWKPDGSIARIDAKTGKSNDANLPPRPSQWEIRYSPSGHFLAASGKEATSIIDLATGAESRLPFAAVIRWLPDSETLLLCPHNGYPEAAFYDATQQQYGGRILSRFIDEGFVSVGVTGHYAGSPEIEQHLFCVARHADGRQETFTPADFTKRFGWKNDPKQVSLLPKAEARE